MQFSLAGLAAEKGFEYRQYQDNLLTKAVQSYEEGVKSVLIWAPTGAGKSLVGLSVLKAMELANPNMTFGWVAMRRKLLEQAFLENYNRVGVKNIKFVSMYDKNPPQFDFMVTDECQHDAANICATMHKTAGAKFALGMTATPFRTDRIKLSYERVISDCGIRYLIEQGYLTNFHQYVLPEYTPKSVTDQILADPKKWGKTIIFMQTTDLCDETQKYLREGGVKCEILLGAYANRHREAVYEQFENGDVQVLINVYLLTEGFDCPDLETVFVRDSGKLCVIQMGGRAFRKDPRNPNKIAKIVQSKQTRFPFTKIARAKLEFIWQEDQWLSLEPNELMDHVIVNSREHIMHYQADIPPYLSLGKNTIKVMPDGSIQIKARKKKSQFAWFGADAAPQVVNIDTYHDYLAEDQGAEVGQGEDDADADDVP